MSTKTCSICSAPDNAAKTVDGLLEKKTALKEIAALSGFSKSAVHRHSQKCWFRTKATTHREMKFDAERNRVLTALPDGNFFVQHDPLDASLKQPTIIAESELRTDDWIIQLIYAPETAPRELAEPEEAGSCHADKIGRGDTIGFL